VTRLIRTSFGDYDLNTIPPGMAIEVPVKSLESQKKRGQIGIIRKATPRAKKVDSNAASVQWIRHQ
jgi:hypothetical protein